MPLRKAQRRLQKIVQIERAENAYQHKEYFQQDASRFAAFQSFHSAFSFSCINSTDFACLQTYHTIPARKQQALRMRFCIFRMAICVSSKERKKLQARFRLAACHLAPQRRFERTCSPMFKKASNHQAFSHSESLPVHRSSPLSLDVYPLKLAVF